MQKRITLLLLTAAFSAQASKPLPFINGMQVTPPALAQWNGELVFDPAWCLQFPDAAAAGSLTTGLLNDSSVALARVEYAPQLRLYVVSSRLPAGRDIDSEHQRQLAAAQQGQAVVGRLSQVAVESSAMGPVVVQHFTNVAWSGPGDALFPLERHFYEGDTTRSVASSRLFAHGGERFEVAAHAVMLADADADADAGQATRLREQVDTAARALQDSLQHCTLGMQPDNPHRPG